MTKEWKFNLSEGDQAISDYNNDIVMYIDDIAPEVIAKVVEMHNSGSNVEAIQKFLDKDERVTIEESDYVAGQINLYLKLSEGQAEDRTDDPPPIAAKKSPEKMIVPVEEKTKQITKDEKDTVVAENKPKATRAPRQIQPKVAGKVSAEELVLKMKEQIRCIEAIGQVEVEIDTEGMGKGAREIMIQLQKAVDSAKEVAIQSIQKL